MPRIIYKSENIIVALKPALMPSQPDTSGDTDLLSAVSSLLSHSGEPSEIYLVHRLDRVVGGLLVLARNKRSCAAFSALAADGTLGKEYLAVVEGECDGSVMEDYLYKNSALSKSFVISSARPGAKRASLSYECLECVDTPRGKRSLVRITLKTGRFHQIRAQFSSRSHPLVGDNKYGSTDRLVRVPSLFAYKICVSDGEDVTLTALPDVDSYPWNLFSKEIYDKCLV